MSKDIFDVEVVQDLLTEEELDFVLSCHYTEEDWDSRNGIVRSWYQLSNEFVSREHAKITINRVLTAIQRFRNS